MLKFISYRIFEAICCFIIGIIASVFLMPVAGIVLGLIIPNFELTEIIQGRIVVLVSLAFLAYWWYLAFTDKDIEAMGQRKKIKT